jgi:hypothetical protein
MIRFVSGHFTVFCANHKALLNGGHDRPYLHTNQQTVKKKKDSCLNIKCVYHADLSGLNLKHYSRDLNSDIMSA